MGLGTKEQKAVKVAKGSPDNLGFLLSWASHALATELTAGLEDLSVSPRAHCVLSTAMNGEMTQREIAQAVGLDKTTMVVTVDELEKAGLAKRVPSETDRRAWVIEVTDEGRRKVAEGQEVVKQIEADVLSALPASERKAFVSALAKLVDERLSQAIECSKPVRRPRG